MRTQAFPNTRQHGDGRVELIDSTRIEASPLYNKDLAPVYGLDPSAFGTDMQLTNLDPNERAGVFTHAADEAPFVNEHPSAAMELARSISLRLGHLAAVSVA